MGLYTYVSADNPWGNSTAEVQAAWRKLYNDAGIRIVVSAFGATDFPTSVGASASETCDDIAEFVLANPTTCHPLSIAEGSVIALL